MCAFIHAESVLQRTWNISSISTEQGNDAESMDGGKKHFFLDKKLKNEWLESRNSRRSKL